MGNWFSRIPVASFVVLIVTRIFGTKKRILGPFWLGLWLKKDRSFRAILLLFSAFCDSFECFYNSNMGHPVWIIVLEINI